MRDEELIGELRQSRVVPVLDPKTEQGALEMIEALVSGGARVVEITLRTPMARDIFVAARSAFPKIVLGAGSVMDSTLYDEAVRIGADFTISPGRCLVLEAHCA
ncbi:MAG: bifunctional 4-hydroxy-2-oxoglutarate aldolase/2-dehydro-3-deoxy-phosphogluconate aldolase, partial [Candidatus Puniceispirillaceae bacterium]